MLDPSIYAPDSIAIIYQNIHFSLLIEGVCLVLLGLVWWKKRSWLLSVLGLIIFIELFLFARGNVFTAPMENISMPVLPLNSIARYISLSEVKDYVGPHIYWNHLRVRQPFAPDLTDAETTTQERFNHELRMLPGNINVISKAFNVNGYSAVVLENYANYWQSTYINSVKIADIHDQRLKTLGVAYAITGYPTDFLENDNQYSLVSSDSAKIYQAKSYLNRAFIKGAGTVEITDYRPESVSVNVENLQPDQLVLTDAYYPGWTAYVDGSKVPIEPFENTFRQVSLEPGSHTVEFRYEPDSVRMGAFISIVSFILSSIIWIWPQKKKSD